MFICEMLDMIHISCDTISLDTVRVTRITTQVLTVTKSSYCDHLPDDYGDPLHSQSRGYSFQFRI